MRRTFWADVDAALAGVPSERFADLADLVERATGPVDPPPNRNTGTVEEPG